MDMSNVNVKDYSELYTQYSWFSDTYPSLIQTAGDEFFMKGLKFVLVGISKNINTLMDKDAYFVTKVRIDKQHDMFFRSSESAIALLLEKSLGKSGSKFNLNRLTDLEAKIITAFNDHMYNKVSHILKPAPPTLKRTNFDVIHMTFILKDEAKGTTGKFIVTVPEILIEPETITPKGEKFSENDFASSLIDVSLTVGSTRFKLIDIKNIEIGDIVVFDNSNTHHMKLKLREYQKDVKINPNLALVIPFDNDEGENKMAEKTNLWDSIEVEMNANFDTVKITLGELKNIEQGLVVDLTSIYDNKVTLSVEDKPIASGELVIVNDRYGVKIDKVYAGKNPINNQTESQEAEPVENYNESVEEVSTYSEESQPDNTSTGDEEFDYSDFELEDEDI